jgi:hypothetical protein
MSNTCFTYKEVKIRKPFQCPLCYRKRNPPEKMIYNSGIYDGSFYKYHFCLACAEILSRDQRISHNWEWEIGYIKDNLEPNQTPEQYLEQLKSNKL